MTTQVGLINTEVGHLFSVKFGLVSLLNGISTFAGYLTPKPLLLEEQ